MGIAELAGSKASTLPLILDGGPTSDLETVIVVLIIAAVVIFRILMLGRANAMRTRCPRCGTVFDMLFVRGPHLGPWRYGRCPSCHKGGLMRTGINATLTWPEEEDGGEERPNGLDEKEELDRRIHDSKYD